MGTYARREERCWIKSSRPPLHWVMPSHSFPASAFGPRAHDPALPSSVDTQKGLASQRAHNQLICVPPASQNRAPTVAHTRQGGASPDQALRPECPLSVTTTASAENGVRSRPAAAIHTSLSPQATRSPSRPRPQ